MFFVFFSIVFVIYGLINTYIYLRGLQAISHNSPLRIWFTVIFWFLAMSYLAARLLERLSVSWLTVGLVWVGSYWMGAMAYFVIILLAIDLLRLVNLLIPIFPAFLTRNLFHTKQVTSISKTV